MSTEGLTERQRKYVAALARNLEKNTGHSLSQWLVIARQCPERAPRARLRWFKENHGLQQNYAMHVLGHLQSPQQQAAHSPARLRAQLWSEAAAAQILAALEDAVAACPDLVAGQRKIYTVWSRSFAFAAARPGRVQVRLGLALAPETNSRLVASQREGWSERLKSILVLSRAAEVDRVVRALLRSAWEKS